MRTIILLTAAILIGHLSLFSQDFSAIDSIPDSIDCIVLKNGFIVKGEIKKWEQGGLLTKKKAVITTFDGTRWDYLIRNINYMRYNGYIVRPLPQNPDSRDKRNEYFMIRIMTHEDYAIYKYEKVIYSDYGPVYDWKYYLYRNETYFEKITNRNYKEILKNYFGNCEYIIEIANSKKNHFWDDKLSKVAINYKNRCQ